jgi:hypothetical protein
VTLNSEKLEPPGRTERPAAPATRSVKWYRRPWIIPLVLVTAAFLYFQLKPFVNLDRSTAPVPPQDATLPYYYILLAHIVFGTLALVSVPLQIWTWFRRRFPVVHRWVGRLYVLSTCVAAPCGMIIVRFAPPVGQIGVSIAVSLWLITTLIGFQAARARNYRRHRKFMLFSFALVANNFWGLAITEIGFRLHLAIDLTYYLEAARWIGWVVNLMLVQMWLDHTARRPLNIRGYDLPRKPSTGVTGTATARAA